MMKEVRPEDVVRGIRDPEKASEALTAAGFFPAGFFETRKRLFRAPEKEHPYSSTKSDIRATNFPVSVAQVVSIAHGYKEFISAEEIACVTAQRLIEINTWFFRLVDRVNFLGQFDASNPIEDHPLFLPQVILWRMEDGEMHQNYHYAHPRAGQEPYRGWSIVLDLIRCFTGGRFQNLFNGGNLSEACSTWDHPETLIRGDAPEPPFFKGIDGIVTSLCTRYPKGYLLSHLPNPLRSYMELINYCQHGIIEIVKLKEGESAISIGFNVG